MVDAVKLLRKARSSSAAKPERSIASKAECSTQSTRQPADLPTLWLRTFPLDGEEELRNLARLDAAQLRNMYRLVNQAKSIITIISKIT